jgi:hypothetical protein
MKLRMMIPVCLVVIGLAGVAVAADQSGTSMDATATTCSKDGGMESYCVADCGDYPDVSCDGGVCSAVNRNCSSHQRGYVVCDGVYTYCPACPECVDGEYWFLYTGDCCFEGREQVEVYKCIGEQWVFQRYTCRPSPECPFYPLR